MEEKYGATWIEVEVDGSSQIVFEQYLPSAQKLHVIYQESSGRFLPYSFVPKKDSQWRLSLWSQENEKAMMLTIESAPFWNEFVKERHTSDLSYGGGVDNACSPLSLMNSEGACPSSLRNIAENAEVPS